MIISSRPTIATDPVSLIQSEPVDSIIGQTVVIKNLDATRYRGNRFLRDALLNDLDRD